MPPTIHIFRSAQAVHNANNKATDTAHSLTDPELTDLGHQQSAALAAELATLDVELVFASPMQRAIQTALTVFETYTRSKRIVLLPDLKDCDPLANSIGSSPDDLLRKFGDARLDFSFMTPDWTDNSPKSRYAFKFAEPRGRSTRLFLRAVAQRYRDTDAHIAVVTHGLYLGYLTNSPTRSYKNAEYRSYYFEQIAGDTEARLIEKPCSIARREKAKSAQKLKGPSIFDLPTIELHNNMSGTHPTTTLCGGPTTTPCGGPTSTPCVGTTSCGGPTLPSCGGPTSPSCGGQQASCAGPIYDKNIFDPGFFNTGDPTSTMNVPTLTESKDTNGSNPAVLNYNFNTPTPMNTVSWGKFQTLCPDLPNKKTTGTPLFNPQSKKQKTTEPVSLFDPPGKEVTEYPPLFNWPGMNNSEKTT